MRKLPKKPDPTARRFPERTDPEHLARVRRLTCCIRGRIGEVTRWKGVYPNREQITEQYRHICEGKIEAHHVTTKARGGHDRETVPLCATGHSLLHRLGAKSFASLWKIDLAAEAEKLSRAPGLAPPGEHPAPLVGGLAPAPQEEHK